MKEVSEIYNDGESKFLLKKLFTVEEYITFMVKIMIGEDYSGAHSFCINKFNLKDIIDEFKKMNANLFGEVNINDYDSESYLKFKVKEGEVFLKGQLGSSFEKNIFIFQHEFDQTIIKRLVTCLLDFLKNEDESNL